MPAVRREAPSMTPESLVATREAAALLWENVNP